ncbi:MAG: hypothetical protein LQ350_003865 [Teloschistes chrysophthalmus]|nr:MAG: hypothetical protein LQ350_003865 [Niorma chrysophthalma]
MPSATGGPTLRLKLVIRRLPPGLTQAEFEECLGAEWQVGSGKVDWVAFKPGKVSKDLAKPSKPSRAYLNVTKQDHISALADKVRTTTFNDAKASFRDSVLLGPPSVEFAPYSKAPHSKMRRDARQGTIDQDPEFIEFLESLTNPVAKSTTVDQQAGFTTKSKEKVTTTPLIQFLKEKKENKGKEAAIAAAKAKGAKHPRQTSKDTPQSPESNTDKTSPAKAVNSNAQSSDKRSAQAIMVEKAARDAARVLNKQAATPTKPKVSLPRPPSPVASPQTATNSPLAEKKRERGSASAAANILRRDLGIGTSPGGRGGRRGLPANANKSAASNPPQATATTPAKEDATKTISQNDPPSTSSTTNTPTTPAAAETPKQVSSAPQPPTGPAASRASPRAPTSSASTPSSNAASTPSKASPITPTATQAFLKHANPSQGITEPLLLESFSTYGVVKRVEIDKKKGSAYVDFEEPEGLQKAIKASPVKVAQGSVVVLERRMGPNVSARNVRGGPMINNRGIPDARGGMMSHRGGDMRGGMINNRGGGIPVGPMGGRGGSIRGRGGFLRGANMSSRHSGPSRNSMIQSPKANNTTPASTTTAKQEPTNSVPDQSVDSPKPAAAPPTESPANKGEP